MYESCTAAKSVFGPVGACLRSWSRELIGIPAALLLPLIPAVHALRLFGRLESETDRSWLVFLIGFVVILPIALGMARGVPAGELDPAAGLWGGFFATYAVKAFGTVGAWIMVALAASVLAAATLRWNPIRMLVGPNVPAGSGKREAGDGVTALTASRRRGREAETQTRQEGGGPRGHAGRRRDDTRAHARGNARDRSVAHARRGRRRPTRRTAKSICHVTGRSASASRGATSRPIGTSASTRRSTRRRSRSSSAVTSCRRPRSSRRRRLATSRSGGASSTSWA